MSISSAGIPLTLYIHIPWCIRKCPYCDFNSYQKNGELPERLYIENLIEDLKKDLPLIQDRKLHSIFIGGGTPSLFSAKSLDTLLSETQKLIDFETSDIEITLEANPGTFEQQRFSDYRKTGINRLSIGIQSFQDAPLKALGRIHNQQESLAAATGARKAGFENFNLDLMHGLPNQSIDDAMADLNLAIEQAPTHLSWYQLTLEPNTIFAKYPPKLPEEEALWDIQQQGEKLLAKNGFKQYEVSAYCRDQHVSEHNLNYWQFGDYLGIGAGAHSKITDASTQTIQRYHKTRNPVDYMNPDKSYLAGSRILTTSELPLEFLMNALRLKGGVPSTLFKERTGLDSSVIQHKRSIGIKKGLLLDSDMQLCTTEKGFNFLNDCLSIFMGEEDE